MNQLFPILGGVLAIIGSLFLLLASVGLIRMPDVYNRMQAGTKATTLGSLMFFAGVAIAEPAWAIRLLLLALFIVFTNPISSHAMIRSAHNARIPLARESVTDALAEERSL